MIKAFKNLFKAARKIKGQMTLKVPMKVKIICKSLSTVSENNICAPPRCEIVLV